jgi:hypothetical protein
MMRVTPAARAALRDILRVEHLEHVPADVSGRAVC